MNEEIKETHILGLYRLLGHRGYFSRIGSVDYSNKEIKNGKEVNVYSETLVKNEEEVIAYARRYNTQRNVFIGRAYRDSSGTVLGSNCISFDIDPIRSKNTASSDVQHDAALLAGRRILSRYRGGYLASSGNGALLVYRLSSPIVDLEDYYAKEKHFIKEIQDLVSDLNVHIDSTNYAEAVIKLIGTFSTKGEPSLRRCSKWIQFPSIPFTTSSKVYEDIASNAAQTPEKVNPTGWIKEAFDSLLEGRTPRLVKLVGRYKFDRWSEEDTFAALKPHAEAVDYDLAKLQTIIDDIYKKESNLSTRIEESDETDTLETFLQDIKPSEWICEPVIAKGSIGFVAGLPETNKTWLMIDLAIECARGGGLWLDHFPVKAARVMFVDQERYKGETQRRFKKVLAEKGIDGSKLTLWPLCGTTTRIDLEESFQAFRRKMLLIRPDLVIIDSFATFHTREENNRKDIQEVLERIKSLRQEFGCTFLFIDHENKSVLNPEDRKDPPSAFKMVGSVGKPAAAETVLTVRKTSENRVEVFHTKSTLAPAIAPFTVQVLDTDKGISIKRIIAV